VWQTVPNGGKARPLTVEKICPYNFFSLPMCGCISVTTMSVSGHEVNVDVHVDIGMLIYLDTVSVKSELLKVKVIGKFKVTHGKCFILHFPR